MILASTMHGRLRRHRVCHDRGARGAMRDEELAAAPDTALHGDQGSYVDAPLVASTTSNEGRLVGQVPSYVRPLDAALLGRGPVWCS